MRLTLADAISRGRTSHRIAEVRAREEGARPQPRERGARQAADRQCKRELHRTNHVEEFSFPQPDGSFLSCIPTSRQPRDPRVSFQWPIYTSGRTDALERAAAAEVSAVGADIERRVRTCGSRSPARIGAAVTARKRCGCSRNRLVCSTRNSTTRVSASRSV